MLVLLFLELASATSSKFCGPGYCVWKENNVITIQSTASGWFGVGIGTTMTNSDLYVTWRNSTGGYTVARSYATIYDQPLPVKNSVIEQVQIAHNDPLFQSISVSFVLPETNTKNQQFIYASSNELPIGAIDSVYAKYSFHSSFGVIGDLVSNDPIFQLPAGWKYSTILIIHGITMFLAWGAAPFVAIFFAKNLKHIGPAWFTVHSTLFWAFTGAFTFASFAFLYVYKTPPHFNGTHKLFGLALMIVFAFQVQLGFFIHWMYDPERLARPWYNALHMWLGRAIMVLAVYTMYLGISLYQKLGNYVSIWIYFIYWGWIVLAGLIVIFGHLIVGKSADHDLEEQPLLPESHSEVILPTSDGAIENR